MVNNLIIIHFKLAFFFNILVIFYTNDHSGIFLLDSGLLIPCLKYLCGIFGVGITNGRNVIELLLIILRKKKHKMGVGSK